MSCYLYLPRIIVGNKLEEILRNEGVEITQDVVNTINELLGIYVPPAILYGNLIIDRTSIEIEELYNILKEELRSRKMYKSNITQLDEATKQHIKNEPMS